MGADGIGVHQAPTLALTARMGYPPGARLAAKYWWIGHAATQSPIRLAFKTCWTRSVWLAVLRCDCDGCGDGWRRECARIGLKLAMAAGAVGETAGPLDEENATGKGAR
jgi:hypothetical protein